MALSLAMISWIEHHNIRENKLDSVKIKSLGVSKDPFKTVKRQARSIRDKILANHIYNKGLISKIWKELIYLNNKTNTPVKQWGRGGEQTFFQRRHKGNWHMKRCSTSLIIRDSQVKTTMWHHLISVRMAVIIKARNSKRWW